jgi:hypothetical protein
MVNWILEDGVFGCSMAPLTTEIQQQGHNVKIIDYTRGITDYQRFFPSTECIVFYGSLHIAQQIFNSSLAWTPGIIGTVNQYDCTCYYPHLKPWLLNAEGHILPLAELFSPGVDKPRLPVDLQGSNRLFIRPNSPLKPFAGGLYSLKELSSLDDFMKRHYLEDPSTLVVVAAEKPIETEWRVVIAHGQVLCASQYRQYGKPYYQTEMPEIVQQVTEAVAGQQWQPDPIWVLDLCCSDDLAYVLEINFLSCSALYQCDLSAVVKAASSVAYQKWVENQQGV